MEVSEKSQDGLAGSANTGLKNLQFDSRIKSWK